MVAHRLSLEGEEGLDLDAGNDRREMADVRDRYLEVVVVGIDATGNVGSALLRFVGVAMQALDEV